MKNEDLKEILDAKFTGIKAEMKASTDMLGYKLDKLHEHSIEQNGKIKCLEEETKIFRLIHRNPRISIIIIILILTGCLTLYPLILKTIF